MDEVRKSTRKRIAKILHDDKTSLSKYTKLDLKNNENITYNSSSISLITLKTITYNSISLFNNQVDFKKFSMNIIDVLFPKKQYYEKLNPSLSRRILWRYITNFRYLDQNMISDDTIDGINITQDNKYKCMGINLFNFSKMKLLLFLL